MNKQIGRPVLVEFWDFCRVNSLRTLPYMVNWHKRYQADGLVVIGVHTGGYLPSCDEENVRAAVGRLEIPYPVVIDSQLEIWNHYGNEGWPARYLWDQNSALFSMHYGEGAYDETESEIQQLLDIERDITPVSRPEDRPGAELSPPTQEQEGAYSGPYEAGGVWAVLEGSGTINVNGETILITETGCHPLIEHDRHTTGMIELTTGDGITCHATCFTAGLR